MAKAMWDTSAWFYGNGFKGNCEKGSKKCCVACSVGKEYLKYEPEQDDVELMVAPCWRWGGDQED